MHEDLRAEVAALAARQHGAFSRDQALALGASRHAIAHAVSTGRWSRVLPSTFVLGSGPLTFATRASATLLYVGGDAALARRSALAADGLMASPAVIDVVHTRHLKSTNPRIRLHRTRHLDASDVRLLDGLRTTVTARSLLDAADDLGAVDLADLAAQAMRRRLVSREELVARLQSGLFDPNTKLLREIAQLPGKADSGVELILANSLRRRGWEVILNAVIVMPGGYSRRGDLLIKPVNGIVQVDSDRFHTGTRSAEDMRRDADWAAAGYWTLRVSPRRIRRELAAVTDEIEAACLAASRPPRTG